VFREIAASCRRRNPLGRRRTAGAGADIDHVRWRRECAALTGMDLPRRSVNARATKINDTVERMVNGAVRALDRVRGRAASYDDEHYEFVGGAREELRRKHYDKSLRLLWKAEARAPWSTFRDCTDEERGLRDMAERGMNDAERNERSRIRSAEFKKLIDESYTPAQRRALVKVLSAIGHGEAYAWLVSATLLTEVKSTGGKAALTMQVLEEAKHFVVMRELMQAFDVPIPRQSAWEYLLLEGTLRAKGLDKFFGMNVLVETIALSIFGMVAEFPGLEVLQMFHLDESRHTALPVNYFQEFPMTEREKKSAIGRIRRLFMALPAIPLVLYLEPELAELGIDAFDFAGSILRKASRLSVRAGFLTEEQATRQNAFFNGVFNAYCRLTREGHAFKNFMEADTSRGDAVTKTEREIFAA